MKLRVILANLKKKLLMRIYANGNLPNLTNENCHAVFIYNHLNRLKHYSPLVRIVFLTLEMSNPFVDLAQFFDLILLFSSSKSGRSISLYASSGQSEGGFHRQRKMASRISRDTPKGRARIRSAVRPQLET